MRYKKYDKKKLTNKRKAVRFMQTASVYSIFLSDYIKTGKPNELAMCCSLRQTLL